MIKNYPRIDYSNKFNKQLKKAPLEIKIAFRTRLELFLKNKYHSQLNNHLLTGKFSEHRSINVTGDWRAIFKEHFNGKEWVIVFEVLGTHSQLYK